MKITPEIKKCIDDNKSLSSRVLSTLIKERFQVNVTYRAIEPHLQAVRAEAKASNAAKVETVRSKILDDADRWANKYLQYTDDEIESLRKLIKATEAGEDPVKLETARDRLAASAALNKMLSTIIDFVKPETNTNVSVTIKPDLSKLSDAELAQLVSIKRKLEGDLGGQGET